MKKTLALLLSIVMILSVCSFDILAKENDDYNLFVGGIKVTKDNCNNVFSDAGRTVAFNPDTYTLTLNNAYITMCNIVKTATNIKTRTNIATATDFESPSNVITVTSIVSYTDYELVTGAYIYYEGSRDLAINVIGNNTIVAEGSDLVSYTDAMPDGISSNKSQTDVVITGDGQLNIKNGSNNIYDGIYSNGGVKVNGPKLILETGINGIHAINRNIIIEGVTDINVTGSGCGLRNIRAGIIIKDSPNLDFENVSYGIHTSRDNGGSICIMGGKIKILCERYGIYTGKNAVTISGGDIYIEASGDDFNPILSWDLDVTGGRVISDSHWGIWANGKVNITGGLIVLKAYDDGLIHTNNDSSISISGGTLILETKKGSAFSYSQAKNPPSQIPDLSGYENVSIDYGSSKDLAKMNRDLDSAKEDEFWNYSYVVIKPKENEKEENRHSSVVIEIGSKDTENEVPEENPNTGAPVLF